MKERVIALVVGLFLAALMWQHGWPLIYSKMYRPLVAQTIMEMVKKEALK